MVAAVWVPWSVSPNAVADPSPREGGREPLLNGALWQGGGRDGEISGKVGGEIYARGVSGTGED